MVKDEGVRAGEHGEAGSEERSSRSLLNLDQSEALSAVHRRSSTRVAAGPQRITPATRP
jgi:hypothetical protein